MKVRVLAAFGLVMLMMASAQGSLWSPPLQNAGFELPDTGGYWSQVVDNWYKTSYWGTFVENGPGIGLPAPEGVQWGGACGWWGPEHMFQQIGTYSGDETLTISMTLGQRAGNKIKDTEISLWVGGDSSVLAGYNPTYYGTYYKLDTDVAATKVATATLLDPWPGDSTAKTTTWTVDLNTGGTGTIGDELWFQITSINGKAYVDAVSIVPEPATVALLGLGGLALIRRRRR